MNATQKVGRASRLSHILGALPALKACLTIGLWVEEATVSAANRRRRRPASPCHQAINSAISKQALKTNGLPGRVGRLSYFFAAFALLLFRTTLPAQTLLNVDFGVGSRSSKIGPAATGQSTNDFWNLYRHYDPKFTLVCRSFWTAR